MANATPVTAKEAPRPKAGPEIFLAEGKKLPEGFVIPEKAVKVVVDERGTVRVDLGS